MPCPSLYHDPRRPGRGRGREISLVRRGAEPYNEGIESKNRRRQAHGDRKDVAKHSGGRRPRGGGQGRGRGPDPDGTAVRRARADRGRAGRGEDHAGAGAGRGAGALLSAHPVHAGPDALGRDGLYADGPAHGRDAPRRGRGHAPADPGRRDQPHRAQDAVRAAGGHAGGTGHGRRRDGPGAKALPRAGHAEPPGPCRHLSAAGGAAGPLPALRAHGLSGAGRGGEHPRPRPP